MKVFIRYLKYVLQHKLYVYEEGRKLGVGCFQLLRHDLSKFRPSEWSAYKVWFYARPTEKIAQAEARRNFFDAWQKHVHRNPHHWQHWVSINEGPDQPNKLTTLPIPEKYVREMLADWRGAGRAISGKDDTRDFYLKRREGILLHEEAREFIERELRIVSA